MTKILKGPSTMSIGRWAFFLMLFAFAGCHDPTELPACGDIFEIGERGAFREVDGGLIAHPAVDVLFYRCPAGQRYVNRSCRGEAQSLSFEDAQAYAVEVSERSGGNWRLPSPKEMRAIQEMSCVSPAYNPNIFPELPVENFWTNSELELSQYYGCVVYTYQGSRSCRALLSAEYPFMLVREPQG
jgi:hypothetical protein